MASSSYLSGARAHVEQQLAQVDALLAQSGYDLKSPAPPPRPRSGRNAGAAGAEASPSSGAVTAGGAAEEVMDTGALYKKALELYGVNANVQSTQDKIRAIQERTRQRRQEFARQAATLPAEYSRGAGSSRPGTATSSSTPSID